MKILIIGASGYIGSHVAAVFADAGHEVSALHRPGGAPLPARYGHVTGNLAEPGALTAAAASYDRVIHAGAPIDDGTDRAGAEALLTSGSPLHEPAITDYRARSTKVLSTPSTPPRAVNAADLANVIYYILHFTHGWRPVKGLGADHRRLRSNFTTIEINRQ